MPRAGTGRFFLLPGLVGRARQLRSEAGVRNTSFPALGSNISNEINALGQMQTFQNSADNRYISYRLSCTVASFLIFSPLLILQKAGAHRGRAVSEYLGGRTYE